MTKTAWRYEIKYGPEGEANYAWVYDADGEMVCTAKTHHAKVIVTRMNATASLQGEDAVERVARIIDPQAWRDRDYYDDYRRLPASEHHATKSSITKARALLATSLVPDEAAIRADEREKCAKVAEGMPQLLPMSPKHVRGLKGSDVAAAIRSGGGE